MPPRFARGIDSRPARPSKQPSRSCVSTPPFHDCLIISEQMMVLFDNGELRSDAGVLVPRADLTDLVVSL